MVVIKQGFIFVEDVIKIIILLKKKIIKEKIFRMYLMYVLEKVFQLIAFI